LVPTIFLIKLSMQRIFSLSGLAAEASYRTVSKYMIPPLT
jgi:hypothetical protein